MNIRKLQQGLKYRGRVAAVRQTYHVFEAQDYFFVLSFALSKARKGSGYFNVVDQAAVNYVQTRLGGRSGVTAKEVVSVARRTRHVPGSLLGLNILYVLVALDQATLLRAGEHRQLFFSVRKKRRAPRP
jgi:fatty acid-binding protein DegV